MAKTPQEELYNALKSAIGKTPMKMKELAVCVGEVAEGDPVPSPVAARIRVQLGKLLANKCIVKTGTRASTRYTVPLKAAKPKPKAKKAKPAAAPKKKAKKGKKK